jgi:hypothetical protein
MPDNMNVERGLLSAVAVVSLGVLAAVTARSGSTLTPRPVTQRAAAAEGLRPERRLRSVLSKRGWRRRRGTQSPEAVARAAQRLNVGSALLGLSVLADSSVEHYRGMFNNKAMFLPLLASAATIATSLHGAHDENAEAHKLRHAVAVSAATTGIVGGGFHLYNVTKRDGGLSWHNLFYSAPLGAPYALILAGTLATAAEHVRDAHRSRPRLFGFRAAPVLAGLTAGGIAGTVAEAALLHFRGAYHDPFMYLPVTVPPVAAGLIAKAGFERQPRWPVFTRLWFWLTAAIGFIGAGFHVYGVSRNMGGWKNWSQNVLAGPPIPAPPSFTGLALAGLAALDLMRETDNG